MASRGLPGFLRRSLRVDYSEDDADDNESAGSHSSSSSLPAAESNDSSTKPDSSDDAADEVQRSTAVSSSSSWVEVEEPAKPKSSPAVLGRDEPSVENLNGNSANDSRRASMPDNMPVPRQTSMERRTSEPAMQSEASNQQENESSQSSLHESFRQSDDGTNTNDSQQHRQEPRKTLTYRESQFDKIFAADVVSMNDLRKLAWNGIPPQYRSHSWKILLGYLPTNASRRNQTLQKKRAEYRDAIAQHYDIDDNSRTLQEQEVLRQVLVDVPRTAPSVQLFRHDKIKRLLARLLYIWAMRHPASSYVQGINDLAMPLIVAFLTEDGISVANSVDNGSGEEESAINGAIDYDIVLDGTIMDSVSDERLAEVEADVYWCLTNLLAGIQDHYTSDQPGVQRMVLRLEELVNRIDAGLCAHLEEVGIQFMQFAFKWMNCLLLREFDLKCVIRLWDTYISEKDGFEDFHVYVCSAFLCQFSSQLQSKCFDELFTFMQDIPTNDWGDTEIEMLLSQAYVLSTLFGGSDAHLNAPSSQRF